MEDIVVNGTPMWYHMSPFERDTVPVYLPPPFLQRAAAPLRRSRRARSGHAPNFWPGFRWPGFLSITSNSNSARVSPPIRVDALLTDWYHGALDRFFSTAQENGIEYMREKGRPHSTMKAYRQWLETGSFEAEDTKAVIE